MKDPFPPCPEFLRDWIRPVADYLSMPTLPLHVHEVIFAIALYQFVFSVLSPLVSPVLFPRSYPQASRRTKINWDVHSVSMVQSLLIVSLALYIMNFDEERSTFDWKERAYGYTGAGGLLQAFAMGYFLWDLIMTATHVEIFGVGMLAHAISAAAVYGLGFRPVLNYWGPVFILFEMSSPFLNIHWALDHCGMTGTLWQWTNGLLLLGMFFSCRLVWGFYNAYYVYSDVITAIRHGSLVASDGKAVTSISPFDLGLNLGLGQNVTAAAAEAYLRNATPQQEIYAFSGPHSAIPIWVALSYMLSNLTLNFLNLYWFNRMVETVRARFPPPFGTKKKEKIDVNGAVKGEDGVAIQRGVYADGRKTVEVGGTEVRSRRKG